MNPILEAMARAAETYLHRCGEIGAPINYGDLAETMFAALAPLMREPDEDMIEAAKDARSRLMEGSTSGIVFGAVWRAMWTEREKEVLG